MEPTHHTDAGYILWIHGRHASSFLPVISFYSDIKLISTRIFKGEILWGLTFVLDTKDPYRYDTLLYHGHIIFVDSNHVVMFFFLFFCVRYFLKLLHILMVLKIYIYKKN
jgi:hypothetical protein